MTMKYKVPLLPPVENPPQPEATEGVHATKPRRKHTNILLPSVPADVARVSELLTRATSIVARELTRLDNKSHAEGLDNAEVQTVTGLVKTLALVGEEERRAAAEDPLKTVGTDELLKRVQAIPGLAAMITGTGTPSEK